jgi:3-(3-hydroxy-phenyl)propionate hydroxylase
MLRSRKDEKPHGLPRLEEGLFSKLSNQATRALYGTQSVQARVHREGRTGLLDDLTGCGWRIVSRHPVPTSITEKYGPLFRALDLKTAHVTRGALDGSYIDLDAEYSAWFKSNNVVAYIERPDFQIFGAVADMRELDESFASLARELRSAGIDTEREI